MSARGVEALDRARMRLQEKADGEDEVTWPQIVKAARVIKVGPTTAARRMRAAGKDVKRHRPREKPQRTPEQMEERARRAKRMRNLICVMLQVLNKYTSV